MVRAEQVKSFNSFPKDWSMCQDDQFCFEMARRYPHVLCKGFSAVHLGSQGMTSNRLSTAKGWEKLFRAYKGEIAELNGLGGILKHQCKLSKEYARALELKKTIFWLSKSYLTLFKNNFFGSKLKKNQKYIFGFKHVFLSGIIVVIIFMRHLIPRLIGQEFLKRD